MRVAPVIDLSPEESKRLKRMASSRTVSVREARRAAITLLTAQGASNQEIAEQLAVGRVPVGRWRSRCAEGGLAAMCSIAPAVDARRGWMSRCSAALGGANARGVTRAQR